MRNEVVSLPKCIVQPFHERFYAGKPVIALVIPRTGARVCLLGWELSGTLEDLLQWSGHSTPRC